MLPAHITSSEEGLQPVLPVEGEITVPAHFANITKVLPAHIASSEEGVCTEQIPKTALPWPEHSHFIPSGK